GRIQRCSCPCSTCGERNHFGTGVWSRSSPARMVLKSLSRPRRRTNGTGSSNSMYHANRNGLSGIDVAALGFGAATLGNLYSAVDDDAAQDAVAVALQRGIRYFDTAPYYGYGLSEQRLGQALAAAAPQERIVVSTKVGRLIVSDATQTQPTGDFA